MPRLIFMTVVTATLLGLGACDTKNIGGSLPDRGPQIGVISVPVGQFGCGFADFSAAWAGGIAPFRVSWDFGGEGPAPDHIEEETVSRSSAIQTNMDPFDNGGTFPVVVTVVDSEGRTDVKTENYTIGEDGCPDTPVLTLISGEGTASITIHGEDPDGDSIIVTATAPDGLSTGQAQYIPAGAGGDVTFEFYADDIFTGASGSATFDGDDGNNRFSNTVTAIVVVPGITLAPDTLYAIPLQAAATTVDTVTIIVATGIPAQPFHYMNGCRVTAPSGFAYVSNTFNIGVPHGDAGDVDGYWVGMNPGGGFLLAPDNFIIETDLGGGLTGIDFNCTPIGGSDRTTDSGALFNFGANFGAGENRLGFQAVQGVNRTYYTDSNAAPDNFWGDISNDHAGVPNTVNVERWARNRH